MELDVMRDPALLHVLGYRLDEIVGKHHSLFIDPIYRDSMVVGAAYRTIRLAQAASHLRQRAATLVAISPAIRRTHEPRKQECGRAAKGSWSKAGRNNRGCRLAEQLPPIMISQENG